jgi:hypothetical protein
MAACAEAVEDSRLIFENNDTLKLRSVELYTYKLIN